MKIIFLIIFLLYFQTFAQVDWVRWSAEDYSYELPVKTGKVLNLDDSNVESLVITTLKSGYYFFISDLDGDNCPFYPSCSVFFVKSVKETNIFQGALMFADRFTRDTNFFKGLSHYSKHVSGKFYDPEFNYELNSKKIKFLPYNKYFE